MLKLRFFLLFVVGVFSLAQGMDIVRDGRPMSSIVIPDNAIPVVQSAAEELQYHIQQSTGAILSIISESKANEAGSKIYLGPTRKTQELKLFSDKLPPNGFTIKLVDGNLFMLGDDSEGVVFGIQHNNRTRVGTLFAVYEFLDKHMGVRWLWPGELGEVIPKQKTITVEKWNQVSKPFLIHSRWRDGGGSISPGWVSEESCHRFVAEQGKWLRRNRFALGANMDITHSFSNYWEKYGKTNPDFFNLLPDGTRRADPYYNDNTTIAMCVSNPALIQEIINNPQHIRSTNPLYLDISENDTCGKCTCPNCLAMDVPGPEIKEWNRRMERTKDAFSKGILPWEKNLGSLSDRYAKFYLAVQKEFEKIDPNVVVMNHAYANYNYPPISTKVNERVLLAIVPQLMYPCTEKDTQAFRSQWAGWRDAGASLMLRPNYTLSGHNFPLFYARKFGEDFRFAAQRGLKGTDFDSLTGQYAAQGPTLYMIARSNNRPDLSVDQVLDEYYHAFGKAENAIRAYFDYWEKISDSVSARFGSSVFTDFDPTGGSYATFYKVAPALFPPKVMAKGWKLLAKAKSDGKDDVTVEKRIAFLELGLKHVELTLAVQNGYRIFKSTGEMLSYAKALVALDKFRAEHESSNMSNMSPLLLFENYTWDRNLVQLMTQPGNPLAQTWKFMWDPNQHGEKQGWFTNEFNDSKWFDIGIEDVWQNQPVGKAWQETHKTPYHGAAWYRTTFSVESSPKAKNYRLIFGAVDKACTIWVNGQNLLHRPWPMPGNPNSWQEAFEVDISRVIRHDQLNVVTVRVESNDGVGGIYRGVWISASDPPEHSNNLIRNGSFENDTNNWQTDTVTGDFEFKIDPIQSSGGKKSARIACTRQLKIPDPITKTTSWGRWFQTDIPVYPEKTYILKLNARTSSDFTGKILVWVTNKSGTLESQLLNTSGIWREMTINNIVPNSNTLGLFLNVWDGTGTIWFDDVELSPIKDTLRK